MHSFIYLAFEGQLYLILQICNHVLGFSLSCETFMLCCFINISILDCVGAGYFEPQIKIKLSPVHYQTITIYNEQKKFQFIKFSKAIFDRAKRRFESALNESGFNTSTKYIWLYVLVLSRSSQAQNAQAVHQRGFGKKLTS